MSDKDRQYMSYEQGMEIDPDQAADVVVAMMREKQDIEARLKELDGNIRTLARTMHRHGLAMVASDGTEVVYSDKPRRKVEGVLVKENQPQLYALFEEAQLAGFEPKFSVSEVENILGPDELEDVITYTPSERVTLKDPKVYVVGDV